MWLLNRVKANTSTTGTGAVTVGTAVAPYQSWSAGGAVSGRLYPYLIEEGLTWELGVGLYNGTTITRPGPGVDPYFASSSGSLLNLGGAATIANVENKSSNEWRELALWDFATNGTTSLISVNIDGIQDLLVEGYDVTCSNSTWRCFKLSVDGGSTYISTGYRSISSTGTNTNNDNYGYFHATATTAARSFMGFFKGLNCTGQKFYETVRDSGVAFVGTPTTAPATNIDIYPLTGNFNGGNIRVLGR